MPTTKKCKNCGKDFTLPPSQAAKSIACSRECSLALRAAAKEANKVAIECGNCGQTFYDTPSHAKRRTFCSYACRDSDDTYKANASANNTGPLNSFWKGGKPKHSGGYGRMWVGRSHPYADRGYILEHRKIMEDHLKETDCDSVFLIEIEYGCLYLAPEFIVHHKDENRRNNEIGNLQCMTSSQHMRLHQRLRKESDHQQTAGDLNHLN